MKLSLRQVQMIAEFAGTLSAGVANIIHVDDWAAAKEAMDSFPKSCDFLTDQTVIDPAAWRRFLLAKLRHGVKLLEESGA